jgi:hypothetical protein
MGVAVRKLEVMVPGRLWDRLEELERRTNIRKEDIFLRAVINLLDGVRCPKCGTVIREFE